ncbi:hypothetical protein SAMN02990966_03861 [Rhodospirillales bacterium URHD0017]|nr:hypothetical protein SAMN02990966_03861 [Rhodospirillales bacterium URHD0017]
MWRLSTCRQPRAPKCGRRVGIARIQARRRLPNVPSAKRNEITGKVRTFGPVGQSRERQSRVGDQGSSIRTRSCCGAGAIVSAPLRRSMNGRAKALNIVARQDAISTLLALRSPRLPAGIDTARLLRCMSRSIRRRINARQPVLTIFVFETRRNELVAPGRRHRPSRTEARAATDTFNAFVHPFIAAKTDRQIRDPAGERRCAVLEECGGRHAGQAVAREDHRARRWRRSGGNDGGHAAGARGHRCRPGRARRVSALSHRRVAAAEPARGPRAAGRALGIRSAGFHAQARRLFRVEGRDLVVGFRRATRQAQVQLPGLAFAVRSFPAQARACPGRARVRERRRQRAAVHRGAPICGAMHGGQRLVLVSDRFRLSRRRHRPGGPHVDAVSPQSLVPQRLQERRPLGLLAGSRMAGGRARRRHPGGFDPEERLDLGHSPQQWRVERRDGPSHQRLPGGAREGVVAGDLPRRDRAMSAGRPRPQAGQAGHQAQGRAGLLLSGNKLRRTGILHGRRRRVLPRSIAVDRRAPRDVQRHAGGCQHRKPGAWRNWRVRGHQLFRAELPPGLSAPAGLRPDGVEAWPTCCSSIRSIR